MGDVTTTQIPGSPFVRTAAAVLGVLALLCLQLAAPAPASAHARLETTSPQDGATLSAAPPEVMLRFNEAVNGDLSKVTVTSGSEDVTKGAPEVDGNSLYQPLDSAMPAGEYTVTYKVVSADGHPVSGSFSFTYGPPEESESEGAPMDPPSDGATSGESSEESPSATDSPTSSDSPTTSEGSGEQSPGSESSGSGQEESPEPSDTSGSEDTAAVAPSSDGGDGSSGVPGWVWGVGGAGVVLVLGAVALLARGRRTAAQEEDDTIEDWRA